MSKKKGNKMFMYGMRYRPFSIGCQPMNGLIRVEDDNTGKYCDILFYENPLNDHERDSFELDYLGESFEIERGERKAKMSNRKKEENHQEKFDDQFALQIKRWFDGYCPKAYKLIHFIFGHDVGCENAREILHHVGCQGMSLSDVVASTYKDVNGTAVQDPKRVEDLQHRFEELNAMAQLGLPFDRFFEKMPNNIRNEALTAPLPISEKNIKDIFLGNAYFEYRGNLYEYDMCENSYLGPKFLFSDINNGDQVSFAFDDVMNGSILY